ncbi:MAG: saccharopine dehydrogenase NADP-binding domain-containing protein, partial [Candidatus Binatia bacterium]
MANQKKSRKEIALIGAGKIGKLTTRLLKKKYQVNVYDIDKAKAKECAGPKGAHDRLDINHAKDLRRALKGKEMVISCCPYFCNEKIALAAAKMEVSYCDLSEDVASGKAIERIAKGA